MANDFSMTEEERSRKFASAFAHFSNPGNQTEWKIEKTDRYWFFSGRNCKHYIEITFWYNPSTLERKETTRTEDIFKGDEHKLSPWCLSCQYREDLNIS